MKTCFSALITIATLAILIDINHVYAQSDNEISHDSDMSLSKLERPTPFKPDSVAEGVEVIENLLSEVPPKDVSTVEQHMAFMAAKSDRALILLNEMSLHLSPLSQQDLKTIHQRKLYYLDLNIKMKAEQSVERAEKYLGSIPESFLEQVPDTFLAALNDSYLQELTRHKNSQITQSAERAQLWAKIYDFWELEVLEQANIANQINAYVIAHPLTSETHRLAKRSCTLIAYSDHHIQQAIQIHEQLLAHLRTLSDEQASAFAQSLENALFRLKLPGKEIRIVGETFEGKTFEWDQLKGKVILVDFWATWCVPCVAEFPRLKHLHDSYHDRGFEIVSISLDENRDQLQKFLKTRDIPWIVIHDKRLKADGHFNADENAKKLGISGVPTMILIDREGKVISTNAYGKELEKLLEIEFAN